MDPSGEFYTLKGYASNDPAELTAAMEDNLEMICRLLCRNEVVRIGELAEHLHVQPPSASKMIRQLAAAGYLRAEKYGYVLLTDKGRSVGEYLLYRHGVAERFLRALNRSRDELEQAEKIEHFLNRATVENLAALTARLEAENGWKNG